jgi:hypothetical protein
MLLFARILFFCLAAPPILLAILFFMSVETTPAVQLKWSLTQKDINRAKHILNEASETTGESLQTIELTEKDLNIATNYLLNRHIKSDTVLILHKNALNVRITLPLMDRQFKNYLNIGFDLLIVQGKPVIKNLHIGPLSMANEYSGQLILKIIQHTPLKRYDILVRQHIKSIQITPRKLAITYYPGPKALAKTQDLLSNNINSFTLLVYQKKLNQVIRNHDRGWRLSLADLLQPLFILAYQRSTQDNAIEENRAAIFVVNSYINEKNIQQFLPKKTQLVPPQYLEVYVYKRADLSKHFIGSAALTASGSSYLADQSGIKKELMDAKKGSGFSFIDLAADRAGTHFGNMATSSPEKARGIQRAMIKISDYTAFMPNVLDLPENLSNQAFSEKYGSIDSPAYQNMLKLIDQRISALPLYSGL